MEKIPSPAKNGTNLFFCACSQKIAEIGCHWVKQSKLRVRVLYKSRGLIRRAISILTTFEYPKKKMKLLTVFAVLLILEIALVTASEFLKTFRSYPGLKSGIVWDRHTRVLIYLKCLNCSSATENFIEKLYVN